MKRVTVIMPVLNEARLIERRLDELAQLGFDDVIVVDGGSTDGTNQLVRNAKLVISPPGRATQLNAGAAVAKGEVLLFLHADVELPRDARSQLEDVLADDSVIAGAFRTCTIADRPTRLGPLLHLADLRSRLSALPYGDQALFVRTDVFRRVGGFPSLPLMEDLALSQRLSRAGRIRIARASVRVSGRRFIEQPVRSLLMMNLFPTLFRLGVSPAFLARFYQAVR